MDLIIGALQAMGMIGLGLLAFSVVVSKLHQIQDSTYSSRYIS